MVATFARLKFLILKNGFRRSPWQIVGVILGLLYGLFIAGMLVIGLVALRFTDVEIRGRTLILGGSILILLWWLVPLVTSKLDQTVDPKRLNQFPISQPQFLLGTSVAGLIGIPGLFTSLVVFATIVTWSTNAVAALFSAISVVIVLALTQFGARLFASLAEMVITSRRGKEILGGIFLLALVGLWPLSLMVGNIAGGIGFDPEQILNGIDAANTVLAWTPLGVAFAAPFDAANGQILLGVLKLVLAVVYTVGLAWAWSALSSWLLSNPPKVSVKAEKQNGFLDGLATDARSAVMVKTFRYWKRDNRLAISNVVIVAIPVIVVIIKLFMNDTVQIPDWVLISIGPMVAALYGWGMHNMLAYDGTAFWTHVATGVRGRDDRIGRFYAEGLTGVVLLTAVVLLSVGVSGQWQHFALVLGLTYAALLTFMGISAYTSVVWIYPVPKPNQSPFASPSGSMMMAMVIQMVILIVGIVALLPIIILYALVLFGTFPVIAGYLIAGGGLAVGFLVAYLGVRFSGQRIDRKGPEILERLKQHT